MPMKLPSCRIVLGIAILAIGCSDPVSETIDELPSVSGEYILEPIGGDPLPVPRYADEEYDTEIDFIEGTLTLRPDSSFVADYLTKYVRGTLGGRVPAGMEETIEIAGTYSVYGDSIRYSYRVDDSDRSLRLAVREEIIEGPTYGMVPAEFTR